MHLLDVTSHLGKLVVARRPGDAGHDRWQDRAHRFPADALSHLRGLEDVDHLVAEAEEVVARGVDQPARKLAVRDAAFERAAEPCLRAVDILLFDPSAELPLATLIGTLGLWNLSFRIAAHRLGSR